MDLKKINLATIQRYTSPQAVKDFDTFLDNLPVNVGYNALIAAGAICMLAAASVWFSSLELQKVSKLHADLTNVKALQPPVPVLKSVPVGDKILKPLGEKVAADFKGIVIATADGDVKVTAQDTDYFPQFLASISYIQRGGRNWKVSINELCVGRDCKNSKLYADLKVSVVQIAAPEVKQEDEKESDKPKAKK